MREIVVRQGQEYLVAGLCLHLKGSSAEKVSGGLCLHVPGLLSEHMLLRAALPFILQSARGQQFIVHKQKGKYTHRP